MSTYSIQRYCQSMWSIQTQMTTLRDTIRSDRANFTGDDRAFLDYSGIALNIYLAAVEGPLNDCIDRHAIIEQMSTDPHPTNSGC